MKTWCSIISMLLFCLNIHAQKEIKIGSQVWMASNLNVDTFRNGEKIPEAKTDEEWLNACKNGKPVWCYYENKKENGVLFGRLYNEYAVNDKRGLAPAGWHIPVDDDWKKLIAFLGGEVIAGKKMKSVKGWLKDGNGNNSSGFNGLPGGYRMRKGPFLSKDGFGCWYSLYDVPDLGMSSKLAHCISLSLFGDDINIKANESGMSVRCVKD